MLVRNLFAPLVFSCPLILSACADDGDGDRDGTTTGSSDSETAGSADAGADADAGDGDGDGDGSSEGDGDGDSGDGDGDGDQSYPEPPYGVEVGDVLEPYAWQDQAGADFLVEDLFMVEPRALVLFATAAWCNPCREEAELLTPQFAMTPGDVLPVGILFEDTVGGTATPEVAASYNAPGTTFDFVADAARDSDQIFGESAGIPRILVVDSRTMTIAYKSVGHDTQALLDAIDALLAAP